MSEAKFTPGPWRIAGKGTIRAGEDWVADVHWRKRDENARLIVAAPDLLRALKCFVADERFVVSVGGNPIVVEKMIEDARAVIARAEGRAP